MNKLSYLPALVMTSIIIFLISCSKNNSGNVPVNGADYHFSSTFWGGRANTGSSDFNYDIRFFDNHTAKWRGNDACGTCPSEIPGTWSISTDNKYLLLKFNDPAALGSNGLEVKFKIISSDSLHFEFNAPDPEVKCIKKFRDGTTPYYGCN
jgi:hypothetical protein